MTPIQQMLLGVGAKKKVYIEDLFSTFLYDGNSGTQSINNAIDLASKGGLVWLKKRSAAASERDHNLFDTERGTGRWLQSNTNDEEQGPDQTKLSSFNSNGFTLGSDGTVNLTNHTFVSWTFARSKGFFDVVTWDGDNNGNRQIAHNLGCVPGVIAIKAVDNAYGMSDQHWNVYHRSLTRTHYIRLNETTGKISSSNFPTEPTATHFSVGYNYPINYPGAKYVAYLFAGGKSDAATARSVDFDGSNDYLTVADSSNDLSFDSNCTIEMWIKPDDWGQSHEYKSLWSGTADNSFGHGCININKNPNGINVRIGNSNSSDSLMTYTGALPPKGQWTHIALVRNSNVAYLYINGNLGASQSLPIGRLYNTGTVYIGYSAGGAQAFNGKISNVRFTASAVYTSSFRPPTEPLTNITNTELLCCNNSSTTGSTVTPGTISAGSVPTASTDSPFDDPAGFVFGDSGTENLIKTGSYLGNGSTTGDGPEVYLGFEPQWIYIKWADGAEAGLIYDSMRGIVTGGNDRDFTPSGNGPESTGADAFDLTPTGFKIKDQYNYVNNNGTKYIYIAIRRPDGYVGKPPELGTDVFAMDDTMNSAAPRFTSGFPVDFSLTRRPTSGGVWDSWHAGARLLQGKYQLSATTNAWANGANLQYYFNNGIHVNSGWSNHMSWMWRRHAGFDVVTTGPGTGDKMVINHGLNKIPEMIWAKKTNTSNFGNNLLDHWWVWHKDVSSANKGLFLDESDGEHSYNIIYQNELNSVAAMFFSNITYSNDKNIMLFFASVEGISSVGSYNGSNSSQTITVGFQPRFLIIKQLNASNPWFVLDTVNGWGSGNDYYLQLQSDAVQASDDFGAPTSTGFTLTGNTTSFNSSGNQYIYYAHA